MPNTQRPSGTGKASIKKQGYTTDGNYGSDPNIKGKGMREPRDLGVKGSK